MVYIVVFICAGYLPHKECDTRTARAYQAHALEGIGCGLPNQMAIASSAIALREDEYVKVKCRIEQH
jgi:hypothetical protein